MAGLGQQVMKTVLAACAIALLLASAHANAAEDMRLVNTVQKVETFVNVDGETDTRLVDTESVVPGDELHYTVTFTNIGDRVVDAGSIVITNPIPDNTNYLDSTAFGAGTEIVYSIDGGESFGTPDELLVTTDGGGQRVAEAREYTHIRWTFTPVLEPGQEGTVTFRVRLL